MKTFLNLTFNAFIVAALLLLFVLMPAGSLESYDSNGLLISESVPASFIRDLYNSGTQLVVGFLAILAILAAKYLLFRHRFGYFSLALAVVCLGGVAALATPMIQNLGLREKVSTSVVYARPFCVGCSEQNNGGYRKENDPTSARFGLKSIYGNVIVEAKFDQIHWDQMPEKTGNKWEAVLDGKKVWIAEGGETSSR